MANAVRAWTLEELHRLPDDGNKYELVFGKLFVTPAPSVTHEMIAARLSRILDPFVAAHGLGMVFRPRAVMRHDGSEVEPDLIVRKEGFGDDDAAWDRLPLPILVVEIIAPTTRRRDNINKRQLYTEARVAEYWIVDGYAHAVRVVRPDGFDGVVSDTLVWSPVETDASLSFDLGQVFAGIPEEDQS